MLSVFLKGGLVTTTVGGKTWAPRFIGVTSKPYLNRVARLPGSWIGNPIDLSRSTDTGMRQLRIGAPSKWVGGEWGGCHNGVTRFFCFFARIKDNTSSHLPVG
eukprot:SAG11_NODE_678_length_7786_cov_10.991804_2_plen_103_part_00